MKFVFIFFFFRRENTLCDKLPLVWKEARFYQYYAIKHSGALVCMLMRSLRRLVTTDHVALNFMLPENLNNKG